MHIALAITSLGGGGAEKVMCWLANSFVRKGHAVSLITLRGVSEDRYALDSRVRRLVVADVPAENRVTRNIERARGIRRVIRLVRPDVVLSFIDQLNVTVLIAAYGLGVPVVVAERSDPSMHRIGATFQALRLGSYHAARSVVVQTETVQQWFSRRGLGARIEVIPNPVTSNVVPELQAPSQRRLQVVSVGRLSREKGHDLLIEAFARVAPALVDWDLVIYGEGAERPRLEQLIESRGLGGRVRLPGRTESPGEVLAAAQMFVLPSRYEGFPNALLEAMAHGLAVVSFDCSGGPAAMIRHGHDGLLVPPLDVLALAGAMRTLMSDPQARASLGSRALEVRERFSEERILEQWERVIERATGGS